ncbi:MAG: transcriptional regulator [Terracidiphilus sp.]
MNGLWLQLRKIARARRVFGVFRFAVFLAWALCAGVAAFATAVPWSTVGPDGGDARSIAAVPGDPSHLYLGTTNSWIYESTDGAMLWHRLAKLPSVDNLVIDHILVDRTNPLVVYAAAWTLSHEGGGLWVSRDGGRSWNEPAGLRGQSIRAFVQAPSDAAMLFAGTLEGVFRSNDDGATWTQISPEGSKEIHEVESLAVDPANPEIVYAGTWHLPWKTNNGGKNWHNIKKGVIDDSDVFSIIIDPLKPHVVYASACSGIYKSETGGELFRKIHGIPATARRTRVLRQDPAHRATVYAGTTEGLYKTMDGGGTFKRMTGPEVIVNDVFIDPANTERVLLATDRGGVLASADGAATFAPANRGISERKVAALMVDRVQGSRIFAGVVNDKTFGSVFISEDAGAQWKQVADGLDGRDVFALAQSIDGDVVAGTSSGIFVLDGDSSRWQPRNVVDNAPVKAVAVAVAPHKTKGKRPVKSPSPAKNPAPTKGKPQMVLDSRVFALDLSGDAWLASTSGGVYTSKDKGTTWQGGPVMGMAGYLSVAAHGSLMAAAQPSGVVLSHDAGQNWWPISTPIALTKIHAVAFSADGTLWVGGREGVYFSRDAGKSWMWVHRLPLVDVDELSYDAASGAVLVSSQGSDFVYAIDAKTLDWKWWETGYRLSRVRMAGGRLLAASMEDGVLAEPKGEETEIGAK